MSLSEFYDHLACELLGVEELRGVKQLPLALPRWPIHEDDVVHYPGGLTDTHEDELQYQVCGLTGLSPLEWPNLNMRQRIVWMRIALDRRSGGAGRPNDQLLLSENMLQQNAKTAGSNDSVGVQLVTPLTNNDRDLLVMMAELDARKHKPETASVIIRGALYRGDEKRAFRNLKANGLVDAKPGKSGGYWLTESGEKLAQTCASN